MSYADFKKLLAQALDECLKRVYEYNNVVKNYGLYLKPIHIVTKSNGRIYIYIAKYWYKLQKRGSNIRWIYVGRKKPENSIIPNPPSCPIERVVVKLNGKRVEIDMELYKILANAATNNS